MDLIYHILQFSSHIIVIVPKTFIPSCQTPHFDPGAQKEGEAAGVAGSGRTLMKRSNVAGDFPSDFPFSLILKNTKLVPPQKK